LLFIHDDTRAENHKIDGKGRQSRTPCFLYVVLRV
jgi:hypothetical protein